MIEGRRQNLTLVFSARATSLVAFMTVIYVVRGAGGPVPLVLAGCIAILVAGFVWPAIELRTVRLAVSSPADAVARRSFRVELQVGGTATDLLIWGSGEARSCTNAPAHTALDLVFERRGLVRELALRVEASGPTGITRWSQEFVFPLPVPLAVAPLPIRESTNALLFDAPGEGEEHLLGGRGAELPAGIRPYMPGDTLRAVDWRATARRREVIVRELEDPAVRQAVIVVSLGDEPFLAEIAAQRAAGIANEAIARGIEVRLVTRRGGEVVDEISSTATEIGRTLAGAEYGFTPTPQDLAGVAVVRVEPR